MSMALHMLQSTPAAWYFKIILKIIYYFDL